MEKILRKIIDSYILSEYPWVKKYEIKASTNKGQDFDTGAPFVWEFYTIIYSPDYTIIAGNIKKELQNLESTTESAVKMLGWDRSFVLGSVLFRTANDKLLFVS